MSFAFFTILHKLWNVIAIIAVFHCVYVLSIYRRNFFKFPHRIEPHIFNQNKYFVNDGLKIIFRTQCECVFTVVCLRNFVFLGVENTEY